MSIFENNLLRVTNDFKSNVSTFKSNVSKVIIPKTNKQDNNDTDTLYPLIDVDTCSYFINNYPTLNAIIRVLSVDMVYNEFNFSKGNDSSYTNEKLENFWKRNKGETKKMAEEWLGYGFGCSEIHYEGNEPHRLIQMPVSTVTIKQVYFNTSPDPYHFVHYVNGKKDLLFRINREDYTGIPQEWMDENVAGDCIWLGGGTTSLWYDYPIWHSAYLDLSTAIKKMELDYHTITNGNIPKAALFLTTPPDNHQAGQMSTYDSLKEQFESAAGGVAIGYFETPMDTDVLKTQYVKIQDDNYDYLNNLIEKTDNKLLELYRVPKARLMIDDTKESMNSNKTQTLYEIYTLDLESYQYPLEEEINTFTEQNWESNVYCEIKTPIFVDTKQIQVQTAIELYDVGIITLKDALQRVTKLYPDQDWTDIDWNDFALNQRFYHGMLFSTPGVDTGMRNVIDANMRGLEPHEGLYDADDSQGKEGGGKTEEKSSLNLFGR